MSACFAPAAWTVVRIADGRREVLSTAPTAAEARRIAADSIASDLLVLFRNERLPSRFDDPDF
jgi:hypothetical protein